ncbi:MAG TPA: hypothetical protein VG722_04310 [Tepidisphaeraceae bacterium]|nr:hypothetical protein [Tepidisphaeraceae bacterium]
MKRLRYAAVVVAVVSLLGVPGQAQNESTDQTPDVAAAIVQALTSVNKPATKLEAFAQRKNAIIVKGFTPVANVPGEDGAALQVTAAEFQDITNQAKEYGLVIDVIAGQNHGSTAYIDYDEIDALASALDYLQKADKNITTLSNFEAQYRTRGDLWLTNYNENGGRMIAIRSIQISPLGQINSALAYFRPASLGDIHQQVLAAKQILDKLRG